MHNGGEATQGWLRGQWGIVFGAVCMREASQSAFGSSFKNSLPRHFGVVSEDTSMGATAVGTGA